MIRLHVPAIPHTITTNEYSHCAFTGKVLRFCPMMKNRGFEVYFYGVETSEVDATKNIELLTKHEWEQLRILSYKHLHPELSINDIKTILNNKSLFVESLANYGTPLYKEFNKRLRIELLKNYRSTSTDIFCIPFGRSHQEAIDDLNIVSIEFGIGYNGSYQKYRIFESYCKLHMECALENKNVQHYWFVIPHFFNILEWQLNLNPNKKKIGFFGRICDIKGCIIIVEIAKRFPQIEFILCGQGDATKYTSECQNIVYKEPIHGLERSKYLGELSALLAPTLYAEPFGCISVEAQLCGTPVITNDFGAFTETIEQFKSGVLCHSLADYCYGIELALENKFDRNYIHERAKRLYSMEEIGKKYEYALKSIMEIHKGEGWYSKTSYLEICK